VSTIDPDKEGNCEYVE